LYGRDRELLALTNRLLSERLVLLYSPSGAGKTSLLMARGGLRDRMKDEGLRLLPPVRVGHAADVAARAGVNRYLLSTLISLELARPEDERRTDEALAALLRPADGELPAGVFEAYLAAAAPADDLSPPQTFLVFDQFEELLTLDPTDDRARREFLRQVGLALEDGDRWALFAMREDHVPALDPYLPLLPTRLSATFRLGLLGKAAAREAVQRPAAEPEFGGTFEDEAAGRLVDELARVQVQDALTGASQPKDGLHVEPLHLQLVCQRLWDEKAAPDRITAADLDRLAYTRAADLRGVTAALAAYYDEEVARVATLFAADGVTERAVRDWFGRATISPAGLRLPVLLGTESSYGLTPAVLRALADRYLIRAEHRHGSIYYELAHDRLVEPVQKSNAAWRNAHLSPFQQAAEVRHAAGRKEDLLVSGEVLAEGERLERESPGALSDIDAAFLQMCRRIREREEAERAQRGARLRRWITWIVVTGALFACGFAGWAFYQWGKARAARAQIEETAAAGLWLPIGYGSGGLNASEVSILTHLGGLPREQHRVRVLSLEDALADRDGARRFIRRVPVFLQATVGLDQGLATRVQEVLLRRLGDEGDGIEVRAAAALGIVELDGADQGVTLTSARKLLEVIEAGDQRVPVEVAVRGIVQGSRRLPPDQAAKLLHDALAKETNSYPRGALARALGEVSKGLPADRAARLLFQILAQYQEDVLPSLEQVAERASLADAAALLKQPLCYGDARLVFLRRVEKLTGQTFKTRWDMVRWLRQRHPDIDLSSPPSRPD
jgi:hypothetical protein